MNWLLPIHDKLIILLHHAAGWVQPALNDLFTAVVIGYLVHHVIVNMVSEWVTNMIKRRLVKTERDFIEWTHYFERVLRIGHSAKHTKQCQDGACTRVVK